MDILSFFLSFFLIKKIVYTFQNNYFMSSRIYRIDVKLFSVERYGISSSVQYAIQLAEFSLSQTQIVSSRQTGTLLLILTTWRNNGARARARANENDVPRMWNNTARCHARQEKRSNFTCNGQFTLLCCIEIASGDQCYGPWCELSMVLRFNNSHQQQIHY